MSGFIVLPTLEIYQYIIASNRSTLRSYFLLRIIHKKLIKLSTICRMDTLRKQPYITGLIACIVILLAFLVLTNPGRVSVGMLIVPIVLIFLIFFCLSHLALETFKVLPTQPRKRRAVGLIISSLMTVIVILQSSGGMSAADLILLALIILVLSIYVSKF
jgi:hypothetical protein